MTPFIVLRSCPCPRTNSTCPDTPSEQLSVRSAFLRAQEGLLWLAQRDVADAWVEGDLDGDMIFQIPATHVPDDGGLDILHEFTRRVWGELLDQTEECGLYTVVTCCALMLDPSPFSERWPVSPDTLAAAS